jgi:hypothetical protein
MESGKWIWTSGGLGINLDDILNRHSDRRRAIRRSRNPGRMRGHFREERKGRVPLVPGWAEPVAILAPMTEEQRNDVLAVLTEVHDRVHLLYPRDVSGVEESDQQLRNRLLAVGLAVHLAQEVLPDPDERKVTERAANLLYAMRLIAPDRPFRKAAQLLTDEGPPDLPTEMS